MKVVFRVDSGTHIGTGHLMRCLVLADAFKEQGLDVTFISKKHLGHRADLVNGKFTLELISGGLQEQLSKENANNYDYWLGNKWEEDLRDTNVILNRISNVDLVVIDHYSIDARYESQLLCKKIMIIDDLMNRAHFCDYLVNQNITANDEVYSKLLKKSSTRKLLGTEFAILRKEFEVLRAKIKMESLEQNVQNILVFFGGTDTNSNTLKFIKSLSDKIKKKYKFKIILNESHQDYRPIEKLIAGNDFIKLVPHSTDFSLDMMNANLFIGAAGTTTLERACLGVASGVISVAENQRPICLELAKQKYIHFLGNDNEVNSSTWDYFFSNVVDNVNYWNEIRKKSFKVVDGLGVKRILNELRL